MALNGEEPAPQIELDSAQVEFSILLWLEE